MDTLYLKALHLIFVVTWFAGLFYIVRLFIYHREAADKPEPERAILIRHFLVAERRLWYGITWPSAIGTYVFGLWMTYRIYGLILPGWLLLKLAFVFGLTLYHFSCQYIFSRMQKGFLPYSGIKLRIWNEVATVFLVSIIFIVVLQGQGNWIWGLCGLVIFSLLMFLAINIYKRIREKKKEA